MTVGFETPVMASEPSGLPKMIEEHCVLARLTLDLDLFIRAYTSPYPIPSNCYRRVFGISFLLVRLHRRRFIYQRVRAACIFTNKESANRISIT